MQPQPSLLNIIGMPWDEPNEKKKKNKNKNKKIASVVAWSIEFPQNEAQLWSIALFPALAE